MALFFFTKKHLALYVEHQLVYISQIIISPLSLCKIILVFFVCVCVCVRACVRACVHAYVYIYIYIYAGNESRQKLYKYLHNHGSYGFLLKCIGLMK